MLGQLHVAAHTDGKATRCQAVTLPGKTDSLIPDENCSDDAMDSLIPDENCFDDAMVTTSYSAELLRSYSSIINCLALRI